MHIGCTRDCQNGLASTILNSTSQPCRPCQLQDACAQQTTNGVRVEYASGTVDRTYLELVALYRAGYIYNAAMVRCMPATNFSTCLSLGVQRPLAQFVTKIESPRMALLGLVSGGSPQTIGISRTTPGPTQCTCHSVYMIYIYASIRHGTSLVEEVQQARACLPYTAVDHGQDPVDHKEDVITKVGKPEYLFIVVFIHHGGGGAACRC